MLSGANLSKADLYWANLSGAILSGADLVETVLGNTYLKDAKGLDECIFHGPCTIDNRTLTRSWPLPAKFLRGCGLTDDFIEYIPSLLNRRFEFYSCFISYSSADLEFAKRLHSDLQDNGVRCWFAPEDLKIGDRTRRVIDDAIRLFDKLLLILSEHSIDSGWVAYEADRALGQELNQKRTILFPVRVDGRVLEIDEGWALHIKDDRNIGDFTGWKNHDEYQKAFNRLLRDLRAGENEPGP